MIVTVTPTVQDGTVVRWYSAKGDIPLAEIASASRNMLLVLDETPVDVRDAAEAAHRELSKKRDADMRHYATHTRERAGFVPIRKDGE